MDELLLDYLLDQLPRGDRAVVAGLVESDPAVAARLRTLSTALAPLAADAEPDAPPPGLALAAIEFTAAHLVANGLFTARDGFGPTAPVAEPDRGYRESRWQPLVRGWVNAGVLTAVVLLTLGLGLAGVQRARQSYQLAVCQDNLRELHGGLEGYSATHEGRYPQAGTARAPTAGEVFDELARTGQLVNDDARRCPAGGQEPTGTVGYAYTLGFRDPLGRLNGLRRPETAEDNTPIAADLPAAPGGHAGWNVLYVGGSVRHLRVNTLPPGGDDLFRNDAGLAAAGLHRGDVCLGRPLDVP
jgi:hypothetical protein